ncbi:hypothetical protein SeMB42_g04224 [Synchytrium endobioticum]|uniref:NmrA-like domain-containing protein n=1 Tax=Synchytrium endobioticum TaxID=286115 RepID=A0A507D039_9FUNG|nr:hypothetical protein SeLEV6574_g06681 [Synchytrium endobioticum]TPX44766.1 hypothetical protein SeMB42_g04224 [Synchytrium endobioticum]
MEPATAEKKNRIFVTGASGQLGSALVKELTTSGLFEVVGAIPPSESAKKVHALETCGVQVCECNAEDPKSVLAAIKEKKPKQMAIIGTAEMDQIEHLKHFIDAGKEAGVEYIMLFSTASAEKDATMWGLQFHQIEDYLKKSLPSKNWTIVRSMFHAENFLWYHKQMCEESCLPLPTEKEFAPVSALDVAHAAMCILRNCQPHHGMVYEMTGGEAKNGVGFAQDASKALGHKMEFRKVTMKDAEKMLTEHGMKKDKIQGILSFYEALDAGKVNYVSTDYNKVTGKDPMSYMEFFQMYAPMIGGKKEE